MNHVSKGRRHGNAKLTEEIILAIRADPNSKAAIARKWGISQQYVSKIKKGHAWKHLNS